MNKNKNQINWIQIHDQLFKSIKEIKKNKRKIRNLIPFNIWVPIDKDFDLLENLNISGLYALYSKNKLYYIGISRKVGMRIIQHLNDSNNATINKIKIKRFNNLDLAIVMEKKLINRLKPKNNKFIVSKNIIKFNESLLKRPTKGLTIIERLEKIEFRLDIK